MLRKVQLATSCQLCFSIQPGAPPNGPVLRYAGDNASCCPASMLPFGSIPHHFRGPRAPGAFEKQFAYICARKHRFGGPRASGQERCAGNPHRKHQFRGPNAPETLGKHSAYASTLENTRLEGPELQQPSGEQTQNPKPPEP